MSTFWQQVEPLLVQAAATLIPLIALALGAWLRARAQTWSAVRGAVREAEEVGDRALLTGPEKHAIALNRIAQAKPGLAPGRASQMIEAVLPEVRRDSLPPQSPRSG